MTINERSQTKVTIHSQTLFKIEKDKKYGKVFSALQYSQLYGLYNGIGL